MPRREVAAQLADAEQALPALFGGIGRLRQQRRLVVDVQHAGGVFGPLHVAGHPEQMISGTRQHAQASIDLVSGFHHPGVLGTAAL
jgi:hypothetical protein